MRFQQYLLNEEDVVSQALAIDEPEKNGEYTDDEVGRKLGILNKAIDIQSAKVDGLENGEQYDAALAILKDLKDKLDKWSNWEEEVESDGPNPPPDQLKEPPPEEEPLPDEDDEEDLKKKK